MFTDDGTGDDGAGSSNDFSNSDVSVYTITKGFTFVNIFIPDN